MLALSRLCHRGCQCAAWAPAAVDPLPENLGRHAVLVGPLKNALRLSKKSQGARVVVAAVSRGPRDGIFRLPSSFESALNRADCHSRLAGPFVQGLRLTLGRDQMVVVLVVVLLPPRGPSNVSWRIWTISVREAVKREVRSWPRPDVTQECGEAPAPLLAHLDTSSTVAAEGQITGMVTARQSGPPRLFSTLDSRVLWSGPSDYPLISHACRASSAVRDGEAPGRVSARVGAVFIVPPKWDFAMIPARA